MMKSAPVIPENRILPLDRFKGICVFLMLFLGITSTGVDNAAHIGGFVAGFLVATLTGLRRKKRED